MSSEPTLSEEIRAEVTRHHDEWDDRAEHLAIKGLYPGDLEDWSTQAAALEAQVARLTMALEVATRGWVRLPDFGDPHCRYCLGTGIGVANYAHTENCPVRVFYEALDKDESAAFWRQDKENGTIAPME